jgi:hypothetical protein
MVKDAPMLPGNDTDEFLPKIIESTKKDMAENADDRLFIFTGMTGAGKSMLAFHFLNKYHNGNINMEAVVIGREKFADAIKKVKNRYVAGERNLSLWNDEADSDNLEQNNKWNKRLFGLYMKIRYLEICHLWCWPSLKAVDRRFIEERVNGIFFCYTKEKFNPRSYAYFTKRAILDMIDKDIRMSTHNLKANIRKYALYIGKFRDYNGPMKKEYLDIKYSSGSDAVDEFAQQFGSNASVSPEDAGPKRYTVKDISKMYNLTESTRNKRIAELRRLDILPPNIDGKFTPEQAELIRDYRAVRKQHIGKYVKTIDEDNILKN